MSEVQAEVQAPSDEKQQQQVVESVEPNVVVVIHLPDIGRDVEIGRYVAKSAWINVKASPIKGGIVYKLKLLCNGIEHSFEALSIFIEFKDKVIFRLTR
jgi:hypothetical protein